MVIQRRCQQSGQFVLFALQSKWKLKFVGEFTEVKFKNLVRRSDPELIDRCLLAFADQVIGNAQLVEHFYSWRMKCRGAHVLFTTRCRFEDDDTYTLLSKIVRGDRAYRSGAGDDYLSARHY
jgi:hypothetical protein